jgi:hypothetical protein
MIDSYPFDWTLLSSLATSPRYFAAKHIPAVADKTMQTGAIRPCKLEQQDHANWSNKTMQTGAIRPCKLEQEDQAVAASSQQLE